MITERTHMADASGQWYEVRFWCKLAIPPQSLDDILKYIQDNKAVLLDDGCIRKVGSQTTAH